VYIHRLAIGFGKVANLLTYSMRACCLWNNTNAKEGQGPQIEPQILEDIHKQSPLYFAAAAGKDST
jgi:hypothetical protein